MMNNQVNYYIIVSDISTDNSGKKYFKMYL